MSKKYVVTEADKRRYERYVVGNEEAIMAAARNGADQLGICKIMGCGRTTLQKIQRSHPVFYDLLRESRDIADLKVESALYRRAIGYEVEEVTTQSKKDEDGRETITSVTRVKKQIAPDTTAQIFWLKNRQPEIWRDRHDLGVTVNPFLELMQKATSSDDE